ncbi:DUF3182 family protein [Phyllobacterium endophyticum]|uniref:DUF3182 family protein n=1 Tax=Phyllobacterium endophyticum TaxID=1149773 RepID=UPI0011C86011|nr:DUF3182 family protein [Phyllobacterium endophyticum]TXR49259.1 DUF3182 family protein [Phyllobacterium endophyticum]
MKQAVVVLGSLDRASHKWITLLSIGRKLARIKECAFHDEPPADPWADREKYYYVPAETLSRDQHPDEAAAWTVDDLFGGVVAYEFMSTKLITHPLIAPDATAPRGWSSAFPRQVRNVVLPGFSVFSAEDLIAAGDRLLPNGPIRVKDPYAEGGDGQWVLKSANELRRLCEIMPPEILTHGLVAEEDLAKTRTYSVGQLCVDGTELSYFGEQRLTTDNNGRKTYGGTKFRAVPGDWGLLSDQIDDPNARHVIAAARHYDACANRTLGMMASRKNYDVITGTDARGEVKTAVLEQSWRAGGATPGEVLALEAFKQEPSLVAVDAASYEVFGKASVDDRSAFVCFAGDDPREGPMTKYAKLEAIYHADQQS